MAIRDNKIYVYGTPKISSKKVNIFLDIEGVPDENHIYLIGLIIDNGNVQEKFSFWANNITEQLRILYEFLKVVGQYDDYKEAEPHDKSLVIPDDLNRGSIEDHYSVPKIDGEKSIHSSDLPPGCGIKK